MNGSAVVNPFVKFWSAKRIFKKGRLLGCLVLIAFVMAPLVCALIFSESMIAGITNKYIYLSDGHLQIQGVAYDGLVTDDAMVLHADSVVSGYALVYSSSSTSSLLVKGVSSDYFNESRLSQVSFETTDLEPSNLKGIALSRATASKLGVSIGDRVALMIVPDDASRSPRPVLVRVEAIFHSGYDQLDSMLSFVDKEYARTLFTSSSSSSVEVLVGDTYIERLDDVIADLVLKNEGLSLREISTWNEHNVSVYNNFVTSKQMILIILLIVIVVAAFYTSSVAQQMIQDDMKPISIAKLIGMADSQVRLSAFISVSSVTVAGIVLGIGLGIGIGYGLGPVLSALSNKGLQSLSFYLLDFVVDIPWKSVLLISVCLMVLSTASVWIALGKTRRITPMRLFTSL